MGDALGIPITMLPEKILNSHDIAGYLTKEMSTMTGLIEGTPIISGGIDAPKMCIRDSLMINFLKLPEIM